MIVGDTGGIGTDLVTYAARTSYVKANLNALDGGAEDVIGDTSNGWHEPDVENLHGGAGGDSLVGSQYANLIHGQGGDDQIAGRDGQDTIHDGPGNDWVYGDGHGSPYLGDGMTGDDDFELTHEGDADAAHCGAGDDEVTEYGAPIAATNDSAQA